MSQVLSTQPYVAKLTNTFSSTSTKFPFKKLLLIKTTSLGYVNVHNSSDILNYSFLLVFHPELRETIKRNNGNWKHSFQFSLFA